MATAALELTEDQWVAFPEDEPGELVHGHLAEEEVPDLVHAIVVGWLIPTLRAWLGSDSMLSGFYSHGLGRLRLAVTDRLHRPAKHPPSRPEGSFKVHENSCFSPSKFVYGFCIPHPGKRLFPTFHWKL